jgi:hypothetical protein
VGERNPKEKETGIKRGIEAGDCAGFILRLDCQDISRRRLNITKKPIKKLISLHGIKDQTIANYEGIT